MSAGARHGSDLRARHPRGVALLLFAAAVLGCAASEDRAPAVDPAPTPAAGDDWPMCRGGPSLTGVARGSLASDLALKWSFAAEDAVLSSPVVAKGLVVAGSSDGKVYGLDLATGAKRWAFECGPPIEAGATIILASDLGPDAKEDRVFFGTVEGTFYALDLATGAKRWEYQAREIPGPPMPIRGAANWFTPADGSGVKLVFGSYDSQVHCVDAATGKGVWTYTTGNYINGSPAISGMRAVVGGCDTRLHVIALADGTAERTIGFGAPIAASAAIDGSRAIAGHYENQVLCADLDSGEIVWRYRGNPSPFFSSPAIGETLVVIGCRDQRLHALDKATGAMVWTSEAQGWVDSSPVICGDKVVVGSNDGRIYLVELATGKQLWQYETGGRIAGSPAVCHGMVIVGSEDGTIYAFAAKP